MSIKPIRIHAIVMMCLCSRGAEEEEARKLAGQTEVPIEERFRGSPFVASWAPDGTLVLHRERLEGYREEVRTMLALLDDKFKEGYSTLNMPFDKEGNQWGEQRDALTLCSLAIALGLGQWCMPRAMWPLLPGGMPYFQVSSLEPTKLETEPVV